MADGLYQGSIFLLDAFYVMCHSQSEKHLSNEVIFRNMNSRETLFMNLALEEAHTAYGQGEIPVGAVIVQNDKIIARAHNTNRAEQNPLRHAETIAIEQACGYFHNERLEGCELYVTKEPCAMCAGAIIHSRITSVYIGSRDEKYGAAGTVFDILGNCSFNHCPQSIFGVCEEETTLLIKRFVAELREKKKKLTEQERL